jgi:DNA-binding NarL/FixJ family response regulator
MPITLVLVRDLMFASKISATAKAAGAPIEMLRDPATLASRPGDRLIIDLNQPGTLDAAIAWKTVDPNRQVIGFVSHVDTQTIAQAKSAGIDRVLARSQFVASLESLLNP